MLDVARQVQRKCFNLNEVENIWHYVHVWGVTTGLTGGCPYYMGENFLINLFETMGEESMAAALRELLLSGWSDTREQEEVVFDTFVKHVPMGRLKEFLELYRQLHGGPYADLDVDFSDDHGDEPDAAAEIAVGETTEGFLDYHLDFDYFRFRAEEGRRYRIAVYHETLRSRSVLLYRSDGKTQERVMSRWTEAGNGYLGGGQSLVTDTDRASYGPQIRWLAPSSGDRYLAVHSFGGQFGRYTLEIAPVETISDDHGNTVATATDISVGEVVKGVVDYDFDLDFFRLQAVAGREYRLRIKVETWPLVANLRLYSPDKILPTPTDGIGFESRRRR